MGAGVCAILAVVALAVLSLFSCLHVSMQLQRTEIWVRFTTAVFLKLVSAGVAVLAVIVSVVLAAIHFNYGGRNSGLKYSMGICFYVQVY